jgi:His/Glu/Gln/Arg/opine family amino acid ABC transporter permease subunit
MSEHLPELGHALLLTVELFAIAMAIGTPVAILVGLGRGARSRPVALLATTYSWFWRVLPLLFILYFGFYGLPSLGVRLTPLATAAILTGLASGAYLGETLHGALQAVPRAQWEAAAALGLPRRRTLRRVVLPQAARVAIGPFISQSILTLKGTSLAGIVGVAELTGQTKALINETYTVWPFLLASAGIYLTLSLGLARLQRLAEVKWAW